VHRFLSDHNSSIAPLRTDAAISNESFGMNFNTRLQPASTNGRRRSGLRGLKSAQSAAIVLPSYSFAVTFADRLP
jgi:hypothetical protein